MKFYFLLWIFIALEFNVISYLNSLLNFEWSFFRSIFVELIQGSALLHLLFFFFLSLNIHISIFHLILWYSPQFQNCRTTNNCITSSNKKKHQRTVKSYFVVVVLLYFVCVFKMSHLPLDLSIVNKRRLVLCFCYNWLMGQKISVASVRNNCRLKRICGSNCVCCS